MSRGALPAFPLQGPDSDGRICAARPRLLGPYPCNTPSSGMCSPRCLISGGRTGCDADGRMVCMRCRGTARERDSAQDWCELCRAKITAWPSESMVAFWLAALPTSRRGCSSQISWSRAQVSRRGCRLVVGERDLSDVAYPAELKSDPCRVLSTPWLVSASPALRLAASSEPSSAPWTSLVAVDK